MGAAIQVQPNASRVLKRWNFDFARARLVEARKGFFIDGHTLEVKNELVYGDVEETYGAKFYYAHRIDLHSELKLLALGHEGVGNPAELLLKKEVIDYVGGVPLFFVPSVSSSPSRTMLMSSRMPKKD